MLPLSLGSLEAENQLLFAITVALLVIASVSISLRSLVRKLILKQFGWDDWAILAAHALYIATCALTLALISTQESIELTQEGPTAANIKLLVRFHNACYVATMITAKVSLGVFFYSLFTGTTHQYQRYLVVASIAVPSIVGVIYLGMTLFSCTASVSLLFVDNCDIQGTYTDLSIIWTALNSGSDLILSTLAVMALLRSKLPPFAKFSAAALLVLGTTGGLASILRLVSQIMAQSDPLQGIVLARWSNTEAGLCIIAASLVTLRPLFGQAVSKRLSRLSGWNWASKEGGTGFSTTSVSSAGPSRANSFFSRNKSVSRSKSRNKSFSATMTNRSIRSVRSQRSGRSRRPSCDPFVEYIDSNAGQSVATAAQESDAVRMPSTIADPGGLLAMEEVKFGEGGGWGKFGDVVVTLEVDVSAEEKKRTKSVCFGPDVEKGAGSSNGARLLMPQRPAFVRTRSAR
ncbi:hypothetical protein B9Z65_1580 [Elsinoe australis]|uniref:Rhodopsin domain-containing protein n=1 Tax=Elsinoe australis TaxID=40998 RepID=A0A2P7YGB9_9PEZI|nr:hypothetical protein B9Z65_1580 [Elsinoe australis]